MQYPIQEKNTTHPDGDELTVQEVAQSDCAAISGWLAGWLAVLSLLWDEIVDTRGFFPTRRNDRRGQRMKTEHKMLFTG